MQDISDGIAGQSGGISLCSELFLFLIHCRRHHILIIKDKRIHASRRQFGCYSFRFTSRDCNGHIKLLRPSHANGVASSDSHISYLHDRCDIDLENGEFFGRFIRRNLNTVFLRSRIVSDCNGFICQFRQFCFMRKCRTAIKIFHRKDSFGRETGRQCGKIQSTGRNFILIGCRKQTIFFLDHFPLAENILRCQTVSGEIGSNRFAVTENFAQDECFGKFCRIGCIRSDFALRFQICIKSIRIDSDGCFQFTRGGKDILFERRVNFKPGIGILIHCSNIRKIIHIGANPCMIESDGCDFSPGCDRFHRNAVSDKDFGNLSRIIDTNPF